MMSVADGIVRLEAVRVPADDVTLAGDLAMPDDARGLVIFAHGSGSSRLSPRHQAVAGALWEGQFATLLFDLLTPEEERVDAVTREHRFDVGLLASRLIAALDWSEALTLTRHLPVGLFGASTGAAGALVAAASRSNRVGAVVSRGGRPDLAGVTLREVRAPTLLIVGGNDRKVIELNWQAIRQLKCERYLEVIPGAGHLFVEPGALAKVAEIARAWFADHLGQPSGCVTW